MPCRAKAVLLVEANQLLEAAIETLGLIGERGISRPLIVSVLAHRRATLVEPAQDGILLCEVVEFLPKGKTTRFFKAPVGEQYVQLRVVQEETILGHNREHNETLMLSRPELPDRGEEFLFYRNWRDPMGIRYKYGLDFIKLYKNVRLLRSLDVYQAAKLVLPSVLARVIADFV